MNDFEPKRLIEAHDPEIAKRLEARHEELRAGASTSSAVKAGMMMGSAAIAMGAVASDVYGQGTALPGVVAGVLNFALTLEYLESEFYVRGVGTPNLIPSDMFNVFDQIRKHEVAHVALLRGVLGSLQVAKPEFDFTGGKGRGNGPFADVFSNPQTFAALSQAFEDTGVRAYKGQASYLIDSPDILETALRVHAVEARHAAEVRRMRDQKGWIVGNSRGNLPAQTQPVYNGEATTFHFILARPGSGISMTEAFDETLTKSQVLDIVAPFLVNR
ncbi:MAG: ferritin-like domain-containing protein [Gemmatimonadaceae bacterium]